MIKNTKRQEILSAAKACFKERGFYGSGVDEIAKKAGITKSLLYYYFKSKDEIFFVLMEESLERIITSISAFKPKTDNPLWERFESILESIKKEIDVLTIALGDILLNSSKTNMIMELTQLNFLDDKVKGSLNKNMRPLHIMFIQNAISFYSLLDKTCEYYSYPKYMLEQDFKAELFEVYKKIHLREAD